MNDALIIAGYAVITAALMAGSYWLGRSERRHPPKDALTELIELIEVDHRDVPRPVVFRGNPEDPRTWRPEGVGRAGILIIPDSFPEQLEHYQELNNEESVRLVPRFPPVTDPRARDAIHAIRKGLDIAPGVLDDWDPPGTHELIFPDERDYWLNLYGDPTKKEAD